MILRLDLLTRMFVDDVDWEFISVFYAFFGTKKRLMDSCVLNCFACIF